MSGAASFPTAAPVSRLAAAPMALFAILMGLGGLALARRRAHASLGVPAFVGEALILLAGVAYAVIALVHVARLIRHPGAHLAEFRHPVGANFVPAFTVATAILAGGIAPYDVAVAQVVWAVAAALHLALAFALLRRWFSHSREATEASPSWFIPVVGTLLMPVVGVPLGFVEQGWFLFSIGAVFWLILAPLMTYRIFFGEPLPERAAPSLFILLAQPAVGGLAVLALNDGTPNAVAHVLYCFAAFISVLVASLLDRVLSTHFGVSWWALTFPCAAFATFALTYADLQPTALTRTVAAAALAFASLVVVGVTALTVRALARGNLVEIPKP